MNNPKCDTCGHTMKKNGKTKAGTQRWRCTKCGASFIRKINNRAKRLEGFLDWLMSKKTLTELSFSQSTFWRKTKDIWRVWPVSPYTGEICDVVFLDGLWLRRDTVVLIASVKGHVLSWHLAQSECSASWAALMMRIPAPTMLVSDGSPGLSKAARVIWPNTRIQRCLFHVFESVKRCTTTRPNILCGQELYTIAKKLLKVKDADLAASWIAEYTKWCTKWEKFLREFTLKDGHKQYTHERLRKARRILNRLIQENTLFTFVEMREKHGGVWPSTNNTAESINSRIRDMLLLHRGMPLMHRIKACFWWCYMHTEHPLSAADILRVMPTDDEVEGLFAKASKSSKQDDGAPEELGSGIVWSEFHMLTEYRK